MLEKSVENQLKLCSIGSWYNDFKKISIKTQLVPIPADVLKYLRADMIMLPKECETRVESADIGDDFLDPDTEETVAPEFPAFSKELGDKLALLGGSAFVKTDWHAPRDSIWITAGQTLRARCISDVYLLLKASSICKEDLAQEFLGDNFTLALRRWTDIHPGSEFRCFVKRKSLIAISPRDWPAYHAHIATYRKDIVNDIVSIFKEKIKDKFPLDDYVFDVYRETKDEVFLIDFSPFDDKLTQSLAFEWNELQNDFNLNIEEEDDPEFRYLPEDCGIQPNPRNNYGIPHDVINLFKTKSNAEQGAKTVNDLFMNRLREECESQAMEDEDDDD